MMDVSEDNRNQIQQVAGRIMKRTGAIAKRGTIHRPGCSHGSINLIDVFFKNNMAAQLARTLCTFRKSALCRKRRTQRKQLRTFEQPVPVINETVFM